MTAAIPPLGSVEASPIALQPVPVAAMPPVVPGFGALLLDGIRTVDTKLAEADTLVRRLAVDDGVPIHHVTMALEEARLSLELAMQVRARLVEGYRELMNMQL
ncbi:flagellar hook-basal body complex protein FliE [Sphingomonas sp. CFBP 13720]|uniref:flagellar hook-basal body complex protein FliE n=1 Tax=Sphingomonas sp. CFBP 13720 TaxID=2775302 RepID=UPI00178715D9|nr:flagellar hook-basal body complex protein FliE [Sphingomonas sp. CFBP 13720]MBD8679346.1 flagellar hook-basal body complex protein FliE [Sphingomonas sp. CFBP 13720]